VLAPASVIEMYAFPEQEHDDAVQHRTRRNGGQISVPGIARKTRAESSLPPLTRLRLSGAR
jgi:hypothetical protein